VGGGANVCLSHISAVVVLLKNDKQMAIAPADTEARSSRRNEMPG